MHYAELKKAWGELTAPGAPFEIVETRSGGRAVNSYKNAPPNVRELWLSTAQFADRDYLVYQDERITYGEAHGPGRRHRRLAGWREGVTPGDRVAIAMRNYPEWLLVYWAGVSIGVAVVGMNAWWVADEVEYALNDSAPKVVFCDARADGAHPGTARRRRAHPAGLRPRRDPAGGRHPVVRRGRPGGGDAGRRRSIPTPTPASSTPPAPPACPKGAQLTHRGCINNLMNIMLRRPGAGAGDPCRATGVAPPETPPTPVVPADHAAVPRHRQQLRRLRGHRRAAARWC